MGKRWTDTDDAVIFAFPAAEAAEILGRTLAAVHERRYRKGYTRHERDRKPQKRLRREYFQRNSQGPREETLPPRPPRTCKYCDRPHFARGLCELCLRRAYLLIRKGYVPLWVAKQRWFR